MDALLLARIQFALTIGFHFLFPAMTLGTALIILISESIYLVKGDETYRKITDFMARLLGAIFVVGAATGIVMEFSFGTNWSGYSRMVGDVFGPILAAEGVMAFFLESVFIGVLLFARGRVSKGAYWASAFLVFLGGHLSAFWIVVANSWMQTPAGYMITPEGMLYLTSFTDAVFNASTLPRFLHTVLASWITCAVMGAGIAAYHLLKRQHIETAKKLMKISMILFVITPLLQLGTGHIHARQVIVTQPSKAASLEGHYDSTMSGVPLYVVGWVDEKNEKTYGIGIPGFLSFLNDWSFTSKITGLNDIPPNERPPVNFVFQTYHIMVGIGMFLIGMGILGGYLMATGRLYTTRWYLMILPLLVPLPHIAHETGWMSAELGRQPWVVYQVLRTSDAVSVVVPAGSIAFSLVMFSLIYLLLFIVFVSIIVSLVKTGPAD
ncbi:MAG: cytochrome ubiquinol oxidase subunit I [Deltaproteobacteria bacterium]|nr:cytochrome ubiquinol oxidase subunit I [Candidatus Zymogenaceae bacterium]